jgi:hypothetical protein
MTVDGNTVEAASMNLSMNRVAYCQSRMGDITHDAPRREKLVAFEDRCRADPP